MNNKLSKEFIFLNLIKDNKFLNSSKAAKDITIPSNYSWCKTKSEYIYCILNNITSNPICEVCKTNFKKFKSFKDGYIVCSAKCKYQLKKQENKKDISKYKIDHTKENFLKYIIKNNKVLTNKYQINLKLPEETYLWCKTKAEYIYCIVNDIKYLPVCKECKIGQLSFLNYSKGYVDFCSVKCAQTNSKTKEKIKQTNINKYGVDNVSKLDNIKEKKKTTLKKNYKVDSPLQSKKIQDKVKDTNLKKFGCENVSQNEDIKEKKIETNLKNNKVKYPIQSQIIKDKIQSTIKRKYKVDNISQSEEIKQKKVDTVNNHYGVDNPFQADVIKDKIKETNIKKWGYEFPIQNSTIKRKIATTNLNKYGNICSLHSPKQKAIHKKELYNKMVHKLNLFNLKLNVSLKNYNGTFKNSQIKGISNYIYYDLTCKKCNNVFKSHLAEGNIPICRKCNPILSGTSLAEKEIYEYIKTLTKEVLNNNRNIINPLELDIFINKYNFAIEYNGLYYHSYQKLNNTKTNLSNKQKQMFKDRNLRPNYGLNFHLLKTLMCEEKNIQLLHINENEWNEKKDILKSMIKSKIGVIDKKLNARDCIIKIVSQKDCNSFLENNHIQGKVNSKINIGLYNKNNELISLMTFSKKRYLENNNNSNEYELLRFVNLKETIVRGAASKLLKYFINNYCKNNDKIITYGDKRYSNGKLYKTLGFDYIHTSPPNYKYFKNLKVYNRQKFQRKHIKEYYDLYTNNKIDSVNYGLIKLYDDNLTEYENMLLNGYDKIFDSGQMKFVKVIF